MQVTMDMSSGQVDRDEYDTAMCAGWNPEIPLMGAEVVGRLIGVQFEQVRDPRQKMPVEMASMEIDGFLRKMYAFQP